MVETIFEKMQALITEKRPYETVFIVRVKGFQNERLESGHSQSINKIFLKKKEKDRKKTSNEPRKQLFSCSQQFINSPLPESS